MNEQVSLCSGGQVLVQVQKEMKMERWVKTKEEEDLNTTPQRI